MEKKLNKKRRISPSITAAIGALITIIGGFFLSYNYIQAKRVVAYDYMSNMFYNGEEVIITEEDISLQKYKRFLLGSSSLYP